MTEIVLRAPSEADVPAIVELWNAASRAAFGSGDLSEAFRSFHRRGLRRVGLGVDGESTAGALELYARVGMRVERRYDVYEKAIREAA